jgi:spermidine synthase
MKRIAVAVLLIALSTLLLELNLIRIFDVLWYPNMAYMIITLAMFAFGLSGVYVSIQPSFKKFNINTVLSIAACLMGISALLILPSINNLPFDFKKIGTDQTWLMIGRFTLIYLCIGLPFFIGGMILTWIFSNFSKQIQRLYFWDLTGAAIGCLVLVPVIPHVGAGGVLFLVCGMSFLAAGLFSKTLKYTIPLMTIGIVIALIPFLKTELFEFTPHMDKRGFRTITTDKESHEASFWDPVSKIDIIQYPDRPRIRWIAYDGGTQTSYFYEFDGDFKSLRKQLPGKSTRHFWGNIVLPSHYIKANTNQEVLIIGSAGGQETKAALTYGAKKVDGIELVGKVVDLGKNEYGDFIGNLFSHPNANIRKGEGRSYLRANNKKYDIIQILSNHTSSSIAAGSGAMSATYLQTVEAYQEYFSNLKADGILHINHHVYPRMVATAAKAWISLNHDDFRSHVVVFEVPKAQDNLPTFLVKMSPWTQKEVANLIQFMKPTPIVINPFDKEKSYLPDEFFAGDLPDSIKAKVGYNIYEPTDNMPFFNHLRKKMGRLEVDAETFSNHSVANLLNSRLQGNMPMDIIHLVITGISSLFFAVLFLLIPLFFSKAGKESWSGKGSVLLYFSCLGSGFILFELIFIQIFMKLIGYPVYTYSTVVFGFLFGAALGSISSEKLKMIESNRWKWAFYGIFICIIGFFISHQHIFNIFLQEGTSLRIIVALVLIFPLAFFLGMPFPLGILTIRKKASGTVAWAWAFNGLFTVIGGLCSVILSISFGFRFTLLVGLGAYVVAFFVFHRLFQFKLENNYSGGS